MQSEACNRRCIGKSPMMGRGGPIHAVQYILWKNEFITTSRTAMASRALPGLNSQGGHTFGQVIENPNGNGPRAESR
jgi:hypothetical protein